ncbi:MAG: cation diffusion facilitator family transporter [Elusimicrobiota bacterium]
MHTHSIKPWTHDHTFGQEKIRVGERRTVLVVWITALTMVLEIVAGLVFGSMALLADGLHMGSHASALLIAVFAYRFTRDHADDRRFCFGTGKVDSLAALVSALLLTLFALGMAWESVKRLTAPVPIGFDQALLVAVVGLLVNGVCLWILRGHEHHDHEDHNLLSAYLHVLADALTSLLAIGALLCGKYCGWVRLDPLMGILGAVLITRWAWGLLRCSSRTLLDFQAPEKTLLKIRESLEKEGDARVADLHVWSVGPGIEAAEIVLVDSSPKEPEHYRSLLPTGLGLVHVAIEVRRCSTPAP